MRILLVHQNFPGQFRALAPALAAAGHALQAISMRPEPALVGVSNHHYRPQRGTSANIHPWLVNTETALLRAEEAARQAEALARQGWHADVVLGHTGWGEMMFMRQAQPQARLLGFNELYYRAEGGDVGFDPEFPADPSAAKRLQVRNMHLLTSLLACDEAITPTHWQADCFPPVARERLRVIHDGIHTDRLQPNPQASVRVGDQLLRHGDEVITFVSRNLEPMRGYHQFMRALPDILRQRPRAHVVLVGGDGYSYGGAPKGSQGYKDIYLNEVRDRLDLSRVHFVGRVPYSQLMQLLQVSAVHVYLTVPFVLSWSLLEAMSLGALVVGSDTAPVREVITHGHNGLLVDFFDPAQLARTVCETLAQPEKYQALRAAARQTVLDRYDFQTHSLPQYRRLIEHGCSAPAPTANQSPAESQTESPAALSAQTLHPSISPQPH